MPALRQPFLSPVGPSQRLFVSALGFAPVRLVVGPGRRIFGLEHLFSVLCESLSVSWLLLMAVVKTSTSTVRRSAGAGARTFFMPKVWEQAVSRENQRKLERQDHTLSTAAFFSAGFGPFSAFLGGMLKLGRMSGAIKARTGSQGDRRDE